MTHANAVSGCDDSEPTRILVVEDHPMDAELMQREITKNLSSCLFQIGATREEFLDALEGFEPDIIIGDHRMLRFNDLEAIQLTREQKPLIPVILLTDAAHEDTAVEYLKVGAFDYVLREHIRRLGPAVRNALEQRRLRQKQARFEKERENCEEQLRISHKMEAIGRLAGGVAHDLNNLFSVIQCYTSFALDHAPAGDSLKNDLLEVHKAGERAVALTRQLLAFSRTQVLQPVSLNLNQIVTGIEKTLQRILGENIEFVHVLAPNLGEFKADPGQIEQVLVYLAINARDAMLEGGKLIIATSNVEVDEEYATYHKPSTPGSYVQLAVTDTGCGMDEQAKAKLLEPFFITKETGKGTRLGLSTVYGIVQQTNGHISCYSEPGTGTTFKIHFQREVTATAPLHKTPEASRLSRGTETILVVEDEEALRKVARRILHAAGYRVLIASNGEEALQVAAQHGSTIQFLLTDVIMPRMGGIALARELQKLRPTIKILYMSGYADDAIVHSGILDPKTNFIGKPFAAVDLTRKIREMLDGTVSTAPRNYQQALEDGAAMKGPPLDSAALNALPQHIPGKLLRAVVAARFDEMVDIVESIRTTQPAVALKLRQMVNCFDYDGLRHFLSSKTEERRGQ